MNYIVYDIINEIFVFMYPTVYLYVIKLNL